MFMWFCVLDIHLQLDLLRQATYTALILLEVIQDHLKLCNLQQCWVFQDNIGEYFMFIWAARSWWS
jgi:hypothetical protein